MKKIIAIPLLLLGMMVLVTSCVKDLDTVPIDKDEVTSAHVYDLSLIHI